VVFQISSRELSLVGMPTHWAEPLLIPFVLSRAEFKPRLEFQILKRFPSQLRT
jgi:hypothetical protein